MKSFLLLMLFVNSISFSQIEESLVIEEFPDVEASFPGGTAELLKFITKNIDYPQVELIDPENCCKIWVQFVVVSTGEIIHVGFRQPVGDKTLEKMALDLFAKMPKWIPAEHKGKKVNSRVLLPISIMLD